MQKCRATLHNKFLKLFCKNSLYNFIFFFSKHAGEHHQECGNKYENCFILQEGPGITTFLSDLFGKSAFFLMVTPVGPFETRMIKHMYSEPTLLAHPFALAVLYVESLQVRKIGLAILKFPHYSFLSLTDYHLCTRSFISELFNFYYS